MANEPINPEEGTKKSNKKSSKKSSTSVDVSIDSNVENQENKTPRKKKAVVSPFETPAQENSSSNDNSGESEKAPRKKSGIAMPTFQAPTNETAPALERKPSQNKKNNKSEGSDATEDSSGNSDNNHDESRDGSHRNRNKRNRNRNRNKNKRDNNENVENELDSSEESSEDNDGNGPSDESGEAQSTRRRRRRRRSQGDADSQDEEIDDEGVVTVVKVREPRERNESSRNDRHSRDRKNDRRDRNRNRNDRNHDNNDRRNGEHRDFIRRRGNVLTDAEFLARRENVDRKMLVRQTGDRTQIAVLEDKVLVEHYVNRNSNISYVGNVYLGRVQNVLPSMEAAFVDIGKGRNAVLYAGEVNWDLAGIEEGSGRKIENVLKTGDSVLVQVTKDPIGQKGARLTAQISLPGRYLVYVPGGEMSGISRRLSDQERSRLKGIAKTHLPETAGVIIRTAAEGAAEEEIEHDILRLKAQWEDIEAKSQNPSTAAPSLLYAEPDLTVRVIRDIFNEDFNSMLVQGNDAWDDINNYLEFIAPELRSKIEKWSSNRDIFNEYRIDEQLAKAFDRKVYLPSGGSLVIDRTEAMVVIDVNTGKFIGKGGNLEETVTKNNMEAAEEIARQLRLRDLGGIVVIDFIDMTLESNREAVLRRLVECLGRDRTKHQVAEVTSLGLVQMTRKRVGQGLIEAFSTTCESCHGRGIHIHTEPVNKTALDKDHDEPFKPHLSMAKAAEKAHARDTSNDENIESNIDEIDSLENEEQENLHNEDIESSSEMVEPLEVEDFQKENSVEQGVSVETQEQPKITLSRGKKKRRAVSSGGVHTPKG